MLQALDVLYMLCVSPVLGVLCSGVLGRTIISIGDVSCVATMSLIVSVASVASMLGESRDILLMSSMLSGGDVIWVASDSLSNSDSPSSSISLSNSDSMSITISLSDSDLSTGQGSLGTVLGEAVQSMAEVVSMGFVTAFQFDLVGIGCCIV